jgi:hypothetical protein
LALALRLEYLVHDLLHTNAYSLDLDQQSTSLVHGPIQIQRVERVLTLHRSVTLQNLEQVAHHLARLVQHHQLLHRPVEFDHDTESIPAQEVILVQE